MNICTGVYIKNCELHSWQAGSLLGPSTLSVFGILKSPHTWMIKQYTETEVTIS